MNILANSTVDGSFWSQIFDHVSKWLDAHLINIAIILFATWLARRFGAEITMRLISKTVRPDLYPTENDRRKRIKTLSSLVRASFQFGTWTIAVLLIVSELRPSYAAALFTSAGVLGLGLAFGAQSLIKDFVNGIFIILENQFRVGDMVTLDKVSGTVEAITVRTTVLRDVDGSIHHVPNGMIGVTTNKTMDYGRINESIVLTGDTPVEKFEKIVNEIGTAMQADENFATKLREAPHFDKVIGLDKQGDLVVRVTAKTAPSEQAKVRSELYKRLKNAATKHKISLHT